MFLGGYNSIAMRNCVRFAGNAADVIIARERAFCRRISYNRFGRACDTACYIHLEAKNALKRKFASPFRKRPEWKLPNDDLK